jgi:hypothetical protein
MICGRVTWYNKSASLCMCGLFWQAQSMQGQHMLIARMRKFFERDISSAKSASVSIEGGQVLGRWLLWGGAKTLGQRG